MSKTPGRSKPAVHHDGVEVVPRRKWGRQVLGLVVLVVFVLVVKSFATNPNIKWSVVGEFFFSKAILIGLWGTLKLTIWSMVFSIILAVVIALMRLSDSKIVSGFAAVYVFIFRGIPMIVLLIFVGNLGLFFKTFSLGIPFTNVTFFSIPSKELMTPFVAAVIGLSLAGAGYMAEIVRASLLSVGRGQREAAVALGCTPAQTLRYIVMPQALKVLIPPMGNEMIGLIKSTAIVSVIAGGDLLTIALGISGVNYRTIELLIVATIWYLIIISILTVAQHYAERRTAEK